MNETLSAQSDGEQGLDNKLKLAGYSYMLGDAAMVVADVARGNRSPIGAIGAGSIWLAGGAAAARYGNPNAEKQLSIYASKLEHFLKQRGVEIPSDIRAQNSLLRDKTLFEKIEDFLYQHPSEMLNAAYGIGAGMVLKQGVDQIRAGTHHLLPGVGGQLAAKFWIGSIIGIGALVGLCVKEDLSAVEKARDGNFVQRVIASVQAQPLRATSAMYFVNNGFLAVDAMQDFNARNLAHAGKSLKPHLFSTLQLATYVFANTMLFLSPRNQLTHAMPPEHVAQLEDAAARIIAAQPAPLQQALLGDISHYMAREKGIAQPPEQIANDLATRITQLTQQRLQMAANDVSWGERARSSQAAATTR